MHGSDYRRSSGLCGSVGRNTKGWFPSAFIMGMASFALLPANNAHADSAVYGYNVSGSSAQYKSIDDAEAAVRANYNQPSAMPVGGGPDASFVPPAFKWSILVQPLGSISWQSVTPPEEWSEPYYKLTPVAGSTWPPSPVEPSCSAINALCSPFGWCPELATEVERVTCQINATYPSNGLCLQGEVETLGEYPSPWVPTNYSYNHLVDPSGQGRSGHSFDYIASGSQESMRLQAVIEPCANGPGDAAVMMSTPSPAPPGGPSPYLWDLGQERYYWCAADGGSHPEGGLPNVCAFGPFKAAIDPPVFKQSPPANCPSEGNPCGPGNGNKSVEELDFATSSISFSRYYNSLREIKPYSFIDRNWSHSFSQRLHAGYVNSHTGPFHYWAAIQNERGLVDVFQIQFGTVPAAYRSVTQPDVVLYYISVNEPMPWVEVFPDGRVLRFDKYGRLREIEHTDAASRTLHLTYLIETPDPVYPHRSYQDYHFYAVDTVVDTLGRGIKFRYRAPSDPPDLADFFVQVAGVDAYPSGESLVSYLYDDEERLAEVVTPSGTRFYEYGEAGQIGAPNQIYNLTSIVDENGADFARYWYDDYGRVTRSEHAGGAGKVELAYTSDTEVVVTRATGEIVNYAFDLGDIWRRPSAIEDGNGHSSSTVLNTSSACPVGLANPVDERICEQTDRRGVAKRYKYGNSGNASLFTVAVIDAAGTPQERRTETDRYDQSLNYRVKEQRVFATGASVPESTVRRAYNTRRQTTARCEIDPSDGVALAYTCSATVPPPPGAKVSRWVTTYCEQPDVVVGTCPLVGLVTSIDGPRSSSDPGAGGLDDVTTYSYYATDDATCATGGACPHRRGDLWKITNALGHVTEYVGYDKAGRVTRTKDANGTLTDFVYHARGWLTDRIVRESASGTPSSDDATLHIDYDAVGNVTRVTQPDASWLEYTYDDAHRLIAIADTLGNMIDYCPGGPGSAECLDAAGNRRVEQIKDPSNNVKRQLRRTYNQLSQLTQVLNATSQVVETSAGLNATGITDGYDRNGNRVLNDDGLGTRMQQDYDPLNRLKATIQDVGGTDPSTADATTQYAYDARDNLRQVTDPDGLNTIYDYDGLNRLTGLHSPDTGDTSYTYDAAGNRISQTDARGVTSTYAYDALNRLASITYPHADLNVVYTYDEADIVTGCAGSYPKGRLTTMSDASGDTHYCYDRRSNVTKRIHQESGAFSWTTEYSYSLSDRLTSITYPSGAVVAYARDALGQIQSVTWQPDALAQPTTLVADVGYAPFGPLTSLTFGNGRTQVRAYDQDYAIDSITGTPAGALTLDFAVDVMGNIVHASESSNPPNPDRVYSYDALLRLAEVETGATPPSSLESYTYNRTGDRLSASLNGGPAEIYAYAPGTHHLASVGTMGRTFDENGNTLTGTLSGFAFSYDDRNRLSRATTHVMTAIYVYNGRGERTRKTFSNGLFGTTTFFVYDEGGHLLGEYDSTGNVLAEYVYLDDMPITVVKDAAPHYIEADHLGTPRQAVDPATSTILWKWDLLKSAFATNGPDEDPDGNSVTFLLNLRFPGQYYDAETGLYYNYHRDYDPITGRYIESDPIGLDGGLNTYVYANQNPLMYIDPTGERWKAIWEGCKQVWKWITNSKPKPKPKPKPELPDPKRLEKCRQAFLACLRDNRFQESLCFASYETCIATKTPMIFPGYGPVR